MYKLFMNKKEKDGWFNHLFNIINTQLKGFTQYIKKEYLNNNKMGICPKKTYTHYNYSTTSPVFRFIIR